MPLHGDSRRIYPEPAPLRDRSPAHRKPGSITQQANGSQPRTAMPALTPGPSYQTAGPRSFHGYPTDFDGQSDQNNRIATTLGQPGPARAGSQSRQLNATAPSRVKTERSDAAAERAAVAAGVKIEVPNTLPTSRAPPMKHQTSQSTDSSVQERGRGQYGNHRSENLGSDRQTLFGSVGRDAVDEIHDDTSLTFDNDRFDDYGENEAGHLAEPTAIFRGRPMNTNTVSEFVQGITPQDIAAAQQWGNNRTGSRHTARSFNQATMIDVSDEDQYGAESMPDDDVTQVFDDDDKADFMQQQIRRDERTPSKPPVAMPPATKRSGPATVKKVSVQSPAQHRGRDRSSSPLPDLDTYRKYGKEGLHNHLQEQAQKAHAVPNPSAGLANVSKVPESHETSEDERSAEQHAHRSPSRKRSFGQIDYDADKLKSMAYADLDTFPFLTDPRAPAPVIAVDANGNPITLTQRLANLSRMNHDDQKSLFQSLTDIENEDVGQWFVQKFGEDLRRLMDTRLERRKVALRYELEAKKRQQEIEVKSADLTGELADLKKGGSQLIEGRGSPRPSKAS